MGEQGFKLRQVQMQSSNAIQCLEWLGDYLSVKGGYTYRYSSRQRIYARRTIIIRCDFDFSFLFFSSLFNNAVSHYAPFSREGQDKRNNSEVFFLIYYILLFSGTNRRKKGKGGAQICEAKCKD
uniref:Uncharacterized protein n=1 Tax=Micrurus lemniscatus lemniscatus TaxID=129467 RepID=A0A2D4I3X6_MICLE